MRISVDLARCENHGQCVFAAPDLFFFDADDRLGHVEVPDPAFRPAAVEAAAACPVRAITIVGDG